MNTLRNTLFFSLTLQICIAAGIFAAAEEAPLVLVTLPIAVASLFLIDLLGWVRPPTYMLNLMALAAFGFAFAEFRNEGEARLLAGGHLVAYLTWTFLLQSKDLPRMWWMFALSVLQVAMGAVLTIQPWFGAALFVYTASTVWTMSLLSLARAALLVDPQLLAPDSERRQKADVGLIPEPRTTVARNGVRTDEHGRWISPRFLGGGVVTFVLMLMVGIAFFVLTPRVWIGQLNREAKAAIRQPGSSTTGFAQNVKLGDIGQVMESNELVMQVSVTDEANRKFPQAELASYVGVEPLFRGAILENYSQGAWTEEKYPEFLWLAAPGESGRHRVKVQISLQPIGSPVLFYPGAALNAWSNSDNEQIVFNSMTLAIKRPETELEKPFNYVVAIAPPQSMSRRRDRRRNRQLGLEADYTRLLATPSTRLTELAKQVLRKSIRDEELGAESAARILESYLRDSNEFSYTLDLSIDDAKIDPVEDFVFNRKRGHCEYFASALALMLRGVGIPTRLISGFKGAEYNSLTGDLEVRDLHAHAWLEARVDGGWITLDPTPGERDTAVATKAKEATTNLAERTRSFWFQGMNYNNSQQEQLVYGPLREFGVAVRSNFEGLMQGQIPLFSQIKSLATTPSEWLSVPGILFGGLLLLMLGGLAWGLRVLLKRWRGWSRERDLHERRKITVAFYARLMALLQKLGFEEIQTLTPREFAQRTEARFRSQFQGAGLDGIPVRLVETFYAVRFGEQPLTADQLKTVDHQLDQLEHCLLQPST